MSSTVNYFAFGSNLLPQRLAARIGRFDVLGRAQLADHRLVFHKRAIDGSGKCTVIESGGDQVLGVIYRMSRAQREVLDEFEGVGRGYRVDERRIITEVGETNALLYVATPEFMDPAYLPFDWYKRFVVDGARHHGLDRAYLGYLESHPCVVDTDEQRQALNARIHGTPADFYFRSVTVE